MSTGSKRPNVLIIMTDEHRQNSLGAYGNADIRTPEVDSLAADGVVFENSFCCAPVCTPSRYSFLTGLYPHQHLGRTNVSTLPGGLQTLPGLLKAHGYKTAAVGKMHFTPTYLDVGFDSMALAEQAGAGRYDDDYHRHLMELGLYDPEDMTDQIGEFRSQAPASYWETFGAAESSLPEEHHSTAWIGERAMEQLEEWGMGGEGAASRLLMVSFIKPHHPFDPPSPWSRMYDPQQLQLLPGWTGQCLERDLTLHEGFFPHVRLTEDKLRKVMALYYGSISHIDHYIGKLLAKLKEKNLYEDTLIMFTSDHGDYMGYHHMLLKGNYMYDPLMKVPLIVKWPGLAHRGERRADLVSLVDVSATVLRQAGIEPAMTAGLDLSQGDTGRDFVFAEHGVGEQYMLRTPSAKLIYSRSPGECLYFDLESDPDELHNVYRDPAYQDAIQTLEQRLFDFLLFETPAPSHLLAEAASIKAQSREQLEEAHRQTKDWYDRRMRAYLAAGETAAGDTEEKEHKRKEKEG